MLLLLAPPLPLRKRLLLRLLRRLPLAPIVALQRQASKPAVAARWCRTVVKTAKSRTGNQGIGRYVTRAEVQMKILCMIHMHRPLLFLSRRRSHRTSGLGPRTQTNRANVSLIKGGGASVNSSSATARLGAMDITGPNDVRGMGCSGRFTSPPGVQRSSWGVDGLFSTQL